MSQVIFVIDDEASITDALEFALQREGFTVRVFHTGQSVIEALKKVTPVLMILDVGLTDGSGFDFFRQYRELSIVPTIFLTARNDEIDRVVGLEMGADDYISKPFSLRELIARVRVVLRRNEGTIGKLDSSSSQDSDSTIIKKGNFGINSLGKKIDYCDTPLSLTAYEYRLLERLLAHPNQVFSRAQLLDTICESPEHRLERTIDTHIKSLRLKLREINTDIEPIKTHRGMGYSVEV